MYTDIVGSMDLTRSLDTERWGFVLDRFLAIAAGAVHTFEGTVNQFTGDGLMAVFGAPLAHEDHARRACLAVLELQREVAGLAAEVARHDGVEFAIRCGLNSGEVVVGAIGDDVHMDFVPVGNTTALGKRIEALAPVGSTAISASTAALVEGEFELRELGEFELKGVPTRQRVLELVGRGAGADAPAGDGGHARAVAVRRSRRRARDLGDRAGARAGRGRARGRDRRRGRRGQEPTGARVRRRLCRTRNDRSPRQVGWLTVATSRSSRCWLCTATTSASASTTHPEVARERVEQHHAGSRPGVRGRPAPAVRVPRCRRTPIGRLPCPTPWPAVADFWRWRSEPSRRAAARDRGAGPRGPALDRRRERRVPRRARRGRRRHADPAGRDLPRRSTTTRGRAMCPHGRLALGPLDAEATGDLLTGLLGGDASLDGLASLIEARTGGNPFFVEEVVQALVENGQLTGARGAYRLEAADAELALPPTVQAGLAARIDRLPAREKALRADHVGGRPRDPRAAARARSRSSTSPSWPTPWTCSSVASGSSRRPDVADASTCSSTR